MKRMAILILVLVFFLSGCSGAVHQDFSDFTPDPSQTLVIYTSHSREVYEPIIREFEQRTGIWVQIEEGGSLELLDKIAAGDTDCDLLFGGSIDSISVYQNLFESYVSPLADHLMTEYQSENDFCTPFSSLPVVLIYNPKLIHLNIPDGWNSLLDPKWEGKIAYADPNSSGSSYTALCTMIQALGRPPEEILPAFYANLAGSVQEDSKQIVDAVSEGSYYIGITLEETALKGIKAGANISIIYPKEGTSAVPDAAAIVAGCAHGDNARTFIDFLLGTDVQNYLQDNLSRRSVRRDIYSGSTLNSDFSLIDYDLDWASTSQAAIRGIWSALEQEAEQ